MLVYFSLFSNLAKKLTVSILFKPSKYRTVVLRPKHQFRHVIYYSIPNSILYVVKKRLNFCILLVVYIFLILISVI